ncbi:ThuA domain-containing protein [Microbacterium sp. CFBP9034]|uniref:ThuA domain-containing protein n=1 Tax=Microbacterium sp. CFBP9034 TaxID=3096540 RepID=UPI002A69A568|nr:ThuA domain-containing protein [Microbacterium sp. CFBP9034]MDY0908839.1 ThuA domain-containing protein [Microbacterium sp. CFBP9034]
MRALIASGSDRYADPWHPFARTSALVADVLEESAFDVAIEHDVDLAMGSLAGVDLLVVNAGDPWRAHDQEDPPPAASIDGFAHALERGIGVLALHCAVSSLRDYPEWAPAIGAMWVPGLSFHPEHGPTQVTGIHLPDGTRIEDFTVSDERYCRLQRIGRSTVVAEHAGTAVAEPTAWVRTVGASRVAVDVLGHDERSYESAGHRLLIRQLARWAVDSPN